MTPRRSPPTWRRSSRTNAGGIAMITITPETGGHGRLAAGAARSVTKRIQYHQYGGADTMQLEDFALPPLRKAEVAVKVKFAAINPIDWKVRNGYLKMVTGKTFPRAMGSDFSGTVIAVGPGVRRVN